MNGPAATGKQTPPQAPAPAPRDLPGPGRFGLAAFCTLVGIALGGRVLWLVLGTDSIPLNRGLGYAAVLALSSLALIAAARALLGPVPPLTDVAPARSIWLRGAVSGTALVVGLSVFGGLTYWLGRELVERSERKRLEEIATLKESLIQSWVDDTSNDIAIWSRGPVFTEAFASGASSAVDAAQGHALGIQSLRRLARTWNYAAVTVRDPVTGARWLTTSDDADSATERRLAVDLASRKGRAEPAVVDLRMSADPAGTPVQISIHRLVTLVEPPRQAVVQVDIDVDDTPLHRSRPGTAETLAVDLLVVRREADAIVVINEAAAQGSRLPLQRRALDAGSIWAAIVQQGGGGGARGSVAAGRPSLAFVRPVARTPWLVVALIAEEVVLGELNRVFLLALTMADGLLVIGSWWWMLYRRQAASESRMQRERTQLAERVADLSRRVVSAQEEERHRLAMELHDRCGANLATINLNLKCIVRTLPQAGPGPTDLLQQSGALLADTIVSIREFCADLRPALLDYAGLAAALRSAASQFEARTGIQAEVDDRDFALRCQADLESGLFRIVQEALLNCAKHSGASTVRIEIAVRDDLLLLVIGDNGKGFDPRALARRGDGIGHGLLNMRDRAALAGGELSVDSSPGAGTRIRFAMPWSPRG